MILRTSEQGLDLGDRLVKNRSAAGHSSLDRLNLVDAVRGLAIAGVVLFHLVWDLSFLRFIPTTAASHPLWVAFGRSLAGTFMVLVGLSLVLSTRRRFRMRLFLRRLIVIAAAAVAITVVTRIAFPATFVYFGILHAIVLATLIGAALLRVSTAVVALLALGVMLLGQAPNVSLFDPRWLAWTGFAASPPPSNDFVPVFPWIGLTLAGIVLARVALRQGWDRQLRNRDPGITERGLIWLGRHSLAIYLVHQPVLLAVLVPLAHLSG